MPASNEPLTLDTIEDALERSWRNPRCEELRVYNDYGKYVTIEIIEDENTVELSRGSGRNKASRSHEIAVERELACAGIAFR